MRKFALVLAVGLVGCSSSANEVTPQGSPQDPPGRARVVFAGGEATLHVDVADDDAERQLGLMWVGSLPPDDGMAFVWDATVDGTFWMKNTLIPLSIAFVGDDDRIHTIFDMTPCPEAPCEKYAAGAPYRLAIEANAGWFDANGIEVGDTAELELDDG